MCPHLPPVQKCPSGRVCSWASVPWHSCACPRFVCNIGREPSSPHASGCRLSTVLGKCIFWAGWAPPKSSPGSHGATVALSYLDIYISVQLTWNSRATCSTFTPVKFWRGVKGKSCLGSLSLPDFVRLVFEYCCGERHPQVCVWCRYQHKAAALWAGSW